MMPKDSFTPLRVWPAGIGGVRVARDRFKHGGSKPHPEHLSYGLNDRLRWEPHEEGGVIGSISVSAFTAWLDQGGLG